MYRFKQLILLGGDLIALYFGIYLAVILRHLSFADADYHFNNLLPYFYPLFLVAVIAIYIVGAYDLIQIKNRKLFYQKIAIAALSWLILGVMYFYLKKTILVSPKTILALAALCGFGLISLWRAFHNKFVAHSILSIGTVFVGLSEEAKELITYIQQNDGCGYKIIGIIDKNFVGQTYNNLVIHKSFSVLDSTIKNKEINLIVMAPQLAEREDITKELYAMIYHQMSIVELENFYEEKLGRIPPFTFSQGWFLFNLREQQKKIYDRFKIIIDYLVALLLGIFFALTFPLIALMIKINSRGTIFFKQNRVGRHGKEFAIIKYRTMQVLNKDGSAEISGPQFAQKQDKRLTAVGKLLRATRLDEVPQFINILRGEMGLIGPRPERPTFVKELTEKMPYYTLRHIIKPGLTGWAQLQQDYYGTIEENLRKLEYDLYYIKHRSPLMDIIIALRTINILLGFKGR